MVSLKSRQAGVIYILQNDAMPGMLKIGHSGVGGAQRAIQLYTTGVPMPFFVVAQVEVDDMRGAEEHLHVRMANYRVSGNREFFRVDLPLALRMLEAVGRAFRSVEQTSKDIFADSLIAQREISVNHIQDFEHVLYVVKGDIIINVDHEEISIKNSTEKVLVNIRNRFLKHCSSNLRDASCIFLKINNVYIELPGKYLIDRVMKNQIHATYGVAGITMPSEASSIIKANDFASVSFESWQKSYVGEICTNLKIETSQFGTRQLESEFITSTPAVPDLLKSTPPTETRVNVLLETVLNAWEFLFGDERITTDKIAERAREHNTLYAIIYQVAGEHGVINRRRLAHWIGSNTGVMIQGKSLTSAGTVHGGRKCWRLVGLPLTFHHS